MKPRPQAVAAYRSRLRTKPQSGSGILPGLADVGYNHAQPGGVDQTTQGTTGSSDAPTHARLGMWRTDEILS